MNQHWWTPLATPLRIPGELVGWMRRTPARRVFLTIWVWTAGLLAVWAVIDIASAQNRLEEEGNPFAELVWVALQSRLIEAAIFGAVVAGVAALVATSLQREGTKPAS